MSQSWESYKKAKKKWQERKKGKKGSNKNGRTNSK
tara:strand:- start:4009 stop:4113 length:105 start_codon:yes stop_codon:yes gene_type:complete